jgi:hypothetical protein
MSDLRHEIDEIGRRIWPDRAAAHRAVQARRRRWWVGVLQPRRPQLAMRWLPLLAAVATVAIFVTLAGARPVLERTQGQGRHPAPSSAVTPGTQDSNGVAGVPGRSVLEPAPSHRPRGVAPAPVDQTPSGVAGSTVSPQSPQRPPATGGDQTPTVTLTEADSGKTVTVSPGTRIVVTLQPAAHRRWGAPHTLDSTIVATSESAADATGAAHGTFLASRSGHTRLVASQGGCHGPLCLIASHSTWWVRVIVR